jgi:hypothetical protein
MEEKWLDTLYFTLIAGVGGMVSYLTSMTDFSFKSFLIKGISSGFAGYLISLLCMYANMPTSMTAFLCGTFGYLGSEVTIALLKKIVTKKISSIE